MWLVVHARLLGGACSTDHAQDVVYTLRVERRCYTHQIGSRYVLMAPGRNGREGTRPLWGGLTRRRSGSARYCLEAENRWLVGPTSLNPIIKLNDLLSLDIPGEEIPHPRAR